MTDIQIPFHGCGKNNYPVRIEKELVNPEETIQKIIKNFKNVYEELDFYEFGTFEGRTLRSTVDIIEKLDLKINNIIGFDSLEGLPEEVLDKKNQSTWVKGEFKVNNKYNNPEEYIKYLNLKKIEGYKNFKFVKGFYKDSLNEEIIKKENLKPAKFINVDCDIYSSTLEILEFIFKNKLYIEGITLIRYDDWGGFYENSSSYEEEFSMGEARAHKEMTEKYNIKTERLGTFTCRSSTFGKGGLEETWFLII